MTALDLTQISPEVQRAISDIDQLLGAVPADRRDLAILGLELYFHAQDDRPLPDHLKSAQLGAAYERARQRSIAEAKAAPRASEERDDDPRVTLIDDGERSGIRLERFDWDGTPPAWLEFSIGHLVAGMDIGGGKPGIELLIDDQSVIDYWPLADLRRLRDDLDRLLRDERLIGALAEQAI